MSKAGFGEGLWCVAGDFNAVSNADERKGSNSNLCRQEIEEFNFFTTEMGLIDLPLLGRKYTWYKSDGSAMSRLDRIYF